MKTSTRRRLSLLLLFTFGVLFASFLVLRAWQENLLYFITPSQVVMGDVPAGNFRLGGMILQDSLDQNGLQVRFQVSDLEKTVEVHFEGIVPDLFGEGQGVVAIGRLVDGVFMATRILAKHDENYMPPEVKKMLDDNRNY